MSRRRIAASALAVVALAGALAGCATSGPTLPPSGAAPDYQLGGAYEPEPGVEIVARDRTAEPAEGLYSICYVNAFQTQPGELDDWPGELLLTTDDGDLFIDPAWPDEVILDTSTEAQREAIAERVGPWIEKCAADGFDAVEFDNLDTYARTDGALAFDDNLALATALVGIAHDAGLAAGQKNAAEDAALLEERAGFDFAVTEECAAFDECDRYTEVYGEHVIDIEYTDDPAEFERWCDEGRMPASVVLRDRDLTTPGEDSYVFALCD